MFAGQLTPYWAEELDVISPDRLKCYSREVEANFWFARQYSRSAVTLENCCGLIAHSS